MKRNLLEWAVLAVSLLSIVVVVGVLVAEGLAEQRPADPRVELHADRARQGELGWIVPASVSNGGDEAVEAVVIEARADVGGADEMSTVEVMHLPAGTTVEIAFSFSDEPDGEVSVRLIGYRVP